MINYTIIAIIALVCYFCLKNIVSYKCCETCNKCLNLASNKTKAHRCKKYLYNVK